MSNFIKSFLYLGLLLPMLIFSSCDNNEEEVSVCDSSSFSFKLNGANWVGETFNNTLIYGEDPAVPGVPTRRADIRATNADGDMIILTFSNPNQPDGDCMEVGSDYVAVANLTSGGQNAYFVTYLGADGTQFSGTLGNLNITSCDPSNKHIQGTFDFEDEFVGNVGTEGQFSVCLQ